MSKQSVFQYPEQFRFGPIMREARKKKQLLQEELAAMLHVTRFTILNWESDKSRPDIVAFLKICKILDLSLHDVFPDQLDLSRLEWNIIENVRLLKPETQQTINAMIFAAVQQEQAAWQDDVLESFREIPLQPGSLGAGTAGSGSYFVDDSPVRFFLRINDRTAKADAVIRISGQSMEPVYHEGDYVYFQYADAASPGEDVVAAWAGQQYVKRMDDRRQLYSVNPEYPFVFDGADDDLRILGRVLGVVTASELPSAEERAVLEELLDTEPDEIDPDPDDFPI